MKVKTVREHSYCRLVVADEAVNNKYGYTNDHPIVLGNMINYFDSGCWSVSDYRLCQHRVPSPYLDDGIEEHMYKTDDEKDFILSRVKAFTVDTETKRIYWHRFESNAYDGDKPEHTDKYGNVLSEVARFSFRGAQKRLMEQKRFWLSFNSDDLKSDACKIPNPYRQPTNTHLWFQFRTKDDQP